MSLYVYLHIKGKKTVYLVFSIIICTFQLEITPVSAPYSSLEPMLVA